jgi:hypothetical protein
MNFATLSPAERMKASALIGLIVVVMFFVVHTLLGVVAPKARPVPAAAPPPATAQASPAPANGAQQAPTPQFPTAKVAAMAKQPEPEPPIPDPFTPLHPKGPVANAAPAPAPAPRVDVSPVRPQMLPPLAVGSALPGGIKGLGNAAPPEERPEIHVIGVVEGDHSVATLEVQGQTMILHPGDVIAKGWRVATIEGGSVWIRHGTELIGVRVGTTINRQPAGP